MNGQILDGSNINIVGTSTTDTLTNKTITSLTSTMGSLQFNF